MFKRYLLDTNMLMALAWADHVHHKAALSWFRNQPGQTLFYTCPITENGFIRAGSHAQVLKAGFSPAQAIQALRKIRGMRRFQFLPDNISLTDASLVEPKKIESYKSLTDAYLLGLAIANGAKLVTLDLRMVNLVPGTTDPETVLEIIETG